MSKLLTHTVNMSQAELKAWLKNPRNLLASIATGHESLRRLAAGDHAYDEAFARKVDNFNTRHGLSTNLFGAEVGGSGWSKRAIALKNWGHDPSKKNSALHEADQEWLADHAGAAARRKDRVMNPTIVTAVEAPADIAESLISAAPFFSGDDASVRGKRIGDGRVRIEYFPNTEIYRPAQAVVPVQSFEVELGLLAQPVHATSQAQHSAQKNVAQMVENLKRQGVFNANDEACLCQIEPALVGGLCRKYPDVSRTPNPPLSQWILPLAQFLVSASGLFYSVSDLFGVITADRKKAEAAEEDEDHTGSAIVHRNRPVSDKKDR
jgi:hypothetical protein